MMRCIALLLAFSCLVKGEDQVPMQWDRGTTECFYEFGWDQDNAVISSGQALQSLVVKDLLLTQSSDGNLAVTEGDKVLWESGTFESQGDYWSELSQDGFLATYMGNVDDRTELIWSSSSRSASDTLWVWVPADNATDQNDTSSKPPVWRASDNATDQNDTSSKLPVWRASDTTDQNDASFKPVIWRASDNGREQRSSSMHFFGLDCEHRFVAIVEGTPNSPGDLVWRQRLVTPTPSPVMEPTSAPRATPIVPFTFYVMGDVPYSPDEAVTLEDQMEELREDDIDEALFLIHLGDFNQPQQTYCDLNHFQSVRDILAQSPVPTLVMAGDNDYQECPSKNEAWKNYLDTFVGFEEDEWDPEFNVDRKSGGDSSRPGGRDLFSFYQDGILFISTALLNKSDNERSSDFRNRLKASADWVRENLRRYQNDDPRGVVLFGHAEKKDSLQNFFGETLKDMFEEEEYRDINALYLCGDRHRYETTRGLFGWDKLDYISVDQGGCAAPILVEVASEDELFSSDSNVFGGGLFRVDRRGGRYSSCD